MNCKAIYKSVIAVSALVLIAGMMSPVRANGAHESASSASVLSMRVKEAFGISLPCSLARLGSHLDGGSVGGLLIGAAGESLLFSWDGAMRSGIGPPPAWVRSDPKRARIWFDAWMDSVDMIKPRLGFIRADYPGNPGAVPLAVGSPAESLLIEALRSCVKRDSSALGRLSSVINALDAQRTKFAGRRRPVPTGERGR